VPGRPEGLHYSSYLAGLKAALLQS